MQDLTSESFSPISTYVIYDKDAILKSQIESYDKFIDSLPELLANSFSQVRRLGQKDIKEPEKYKEITFEIYYRNVRVAQNYYSDINNAQKPEYPGYCKSNRKTYRLKLILDIEIHQQAIPIAGGVPTEKIITKIPNMPVGDIPQPTNNKRCHKKGLDAISLVAIGEDPDDLGGVYIVDGSEKGIIATKNIIKNVPMFYLQHKEGITAQCNIICQHGDGFDMSHYLVLKLMNDDSLVIEITLSRKVVLVLPFFILYKIFNVGTDKAIFDTILPNYDDKNLREKQINILLSKALTHKYHKTRKGISGQNYFNRYYNEDDSLIDDPTQLILILADIMDTIDVGATAVKFVQDKSILKASNDEKKSIIESVLKKLDAIILSHIGVTEAERIKKMRYLGSLIRRLYGVFLGDTQSDRNSLANLVVNTACPTLIMSFKTIFNVTINAKLINDLIKRYKASHYPLNISNAVASIINTTDLCDGLCKALKAGNKKSISINRTKTTNRVVTNQIEYINQVSVLNTLRGLANTKDIGGKTNSAVIESRNVNPSFAGNLCMQQSVEGSQAGLVSAFALNVDFTEAIYSEAIKNILLENSDIEPTERISHKDGQYYSLIYFNGNPIGSHYDTVTLAKTYREMRRNGLINRTTSITYEPLSNGELHINTQKGRAIRPLVIVYNNMADYIEGKAKEFKQWVTYTNDHADGLRNRTINLQDLVERKVIEYISPIEYKNIFVCPSYEQFLESQNDPLSEYTHLDLPLSNYGLSITACPYATHAASIRTTYEGNQRRQTLGIPVLNYDRATLNKLYLAYYSWEPISSTILNRVARSDGAPITVAVMSYSDNQEDSVVISETLTTNGKFTINYYHNIVGELDAGQHFGTPDKTTTEMKATSYAHLIDGEPKPGTVITKGMPIIGIIERTNKENGTKVDRSIIHKKRKPVIVDSLNRLPHNQYGRGMIIVKVHTVRPLVPGDKLSARSGGKAITSRSEYDEAIPMTASGLTIDMVLNPHAFPSRMILGQQHDSAESKQAVFLGIGTEVTAYKTLSDEEMLEMEKYTGLKYDGTEKVYDGRTGAPLRRDIFVCPTYYQRLSKMIEDTSSLVEKPIVDLRTQQRAKGINNNGGTHFGEMERETALAVGAISSVHDKMFKDSDGKKGYICDSCHQLANVSVSNNLYKCKNCPNTTFSEVPTTFGTFNLLKYAAIIGIGTDLYTTSAEFL